MTDTDGMTDAQRERHTRLVDQGFERVLTVYAGVVYTGGKTQDVFYAVGDDGRRSDEGFYFEHKARSLPGYEPGSLYAVYRKNNAYRFPVAAEAYGGKWADSAEVAKWQMTTRAARLEIRAAAQAKTLDYDRLTRALEPFSYLYARAAPNQRLAFELLVLQALRDGITRRAKYR